MNKTDSDTIGTYSPVRQVVIDERNISQRLDNFLITQLKGLPKSRIYRLIRKGEVRVNGKRAEAAHKLETGDNVRIPPVKIPTRQPEVKPGPRIVQQLESSILFEDDALLVINKPAGIAVHGGSGINGGVIETFRSMRPEARFMELVHRIDRDTSGCLLIAKKRSLLRHLHEEIRTGRMHKVYQVLVSGRWPSGKREINARLEKNVLHSGERIVRVNHDRGKPSRTWFEVIERYQDLTLLKATLDTGRTHQIRVHALNAGHPVVGDKKYGNKAVEEKAKKYALRRLMLHAWKIAFHLPDRERVEFEASPPEEFENSIIGLRQKTNSP